MNNIDKIRGKAIVELQNRLIRDKSEVIFTIIDNKIIGNDSSELKIVEDAKIHYNKFNECIFKNIKFKNCSIYGSVFSGCNFNNVVFDNCNFFKSPVDISIFDCGCLFRDCSFENCHLEKSVFIDSKLYNTKFILTNLKNAILDKVYLKDLHIIDCDMRSIKIINSKIQKLVFEDDFLTKLDEESFIDEIILDKKETGNYEDVFKVYKNISSKFEANMLPNKSGEYYYLFKKVENKALKGVDKIKSYIFWGLCGYGEKPTYALITSFEIVLIFTIIYMFTGLSIGGETIDYQLLILKDLPIDGLFFDFTKSLYFSIVTFTTVGYGDITPIGYSVLLSGIEMFLGVTMVGIWTATLARKITR